VKVHPVPHGDGEFPPLIRRLLGGKNGWDEQEAKNRGKTMHSASDENGKEGN
jgi:hypothetical protein